MDSMTPRPPSVLPDQIRMLEPDPPVFAGAADTQADLSCSDYH
jgi:hypothetical protein